MAEMQRARLIPVGGIGSELEAEQRATSALLAVISIVRDFSNALLDPLGAPRGKRAIVDTFTEIDIKLASGAKVRPDGLIRVTYGQTEWVALVEVKTGDAPLRAEQVNNYIQAAREIDAQVVLTISNEIGVAGSHPTAGLNVRSNSRVQVHHLPWTRILSHAVQAKVHHGVADPEQAWILGELIRYLEHPSAGATAMTDMGAPWIAIRDEARNGGIKKGSAEAGEVAARWDQLIRYAAMRLSAETGANVEQFLPRAQRDPQARLSHLRQQLADSCVLEGRLRVPGSVGDIVVIADLKAKQIRAEVSVPAPEDRKGRGSVTWLSRQIADTAHRAVLIESYAKNARSPVAAPLAAVLEEPTVLLADGQQDIARFVVAQRFEMGAARKAGGKTAGFIDSVLGAIDALYTGVVQHITPWTPPAPQVATVSRTDVAPQPTSNDGDTTVAMPPTVPTRMWEPRPGPPVIEW